MWKLINSYPSYEVSDDGQIRNKKTGMLVRQYKDKNGYCTVFLKKPNIRRTAHVRVHREVAFAFVDGYFDGAQVNHIDEDKANNNANNLEWCDLKHNINHGTRTERAIAHCKKPVAAYKDGIEVFRFPSTCDAQRATGIHQQNISKCCNHVKNFKTAGGYSWAYL